MENIYSFFILCFVFSPIFILSLENEYLFSARIPKLLPLFRIAFLNPIKEFKKISEKSYYSRYYNFAYNANYHSYDYYVRQNNWGYSKRIGYYNTLILANRIFEFRIWLSLRSIKNYEELKLKALLLLNEVNKFLKLSKKEKVTFVDEIAKNISDEKINKIYAIEFLSALESTLYKIDHLKNTKILGAIIKARDYMNDRSPSVKQLLEYIALIS